MRLRLLRVVVCMYIARGGLGCFGCFGWVACPRHCLALSTDRLPGFDPLLRCVDWLFVCAECSMTLVGL